MKEGRMKVRNRRRGGGKDEEEGTEEEVGWKQRLQADKQHSAIVDSPRAALFTRIATIATERTIGTVRPARSR